MESWKDFRFTGDPRTAEGRLLARMPKPSVLKTRTVTITFKRR